MTINASPETVQAVTDVFKLAAALDDRVAQPDKARIIAWSEQVQRNRLTASDLLNATQDYYDARSDRPIQVGDLIHHARLIRRDRLDRNPPSSTSVTTGTEVLDIEVLALITGSVGTAETPTTTPTTRDPVERYERAKAALQTCYGKAQSQAAIREFYAAKASVPKHLRTPTAATYAGTPSQQRDFTSPIHGRDDQ